MSKKATNYFIEDWGDRKPHEIIIRYDETELSLTVSDVGRTMQAYADEQVKEYEESLNVFKLFDCPTQENGLCNCTNKCRKGNEHLKQK